MTSILCVDDNQFGLKVRMLVLQAFGFEVHGTSEPEAAIRLLQDRDFDLAVVDYLLLTTTGTALAQAMKQLRPSLLVLLHSGSVEEPTGMEHVDGFLSKSESPEKLVATIRGLIAAHQFDLA